MTFYIAIMLIIVAFIGGGTIGIFIMGALVMSREADEHSEFIGHESYRGGSDD